MKNLRKSILFLIIYLFLYLNLGLFNNTGSSFFKINPELYLLTALASIIMITIPVFRKLSVSISLIIWNLFYVFCWIIIRNNAFNEILHSPLTIVPEIILFSIVIILIKRTSQDISDVEHVIQNVILPDVNNRILDMNVAEPVIEDELIRSRRYDYPVSAVILKPDEWIKNQPTPEELQRAANEIQEFLKVRYSVTKMGKIIGEQTRRTDFMIRIDNENYFIIICPEISNQNAILLAERLQNISMETLNIPLSYGIATFPDNGPSFQAILESAQTDLLKNNPA